MIAKDIQNKMTSLDITLPHDHMTQKEVVAYRKPGTRIKVETGHYLYRSRVTGILWRIIKHNDGEWMPEYFQDADPFPSEGYSTLGEAINSL